MIPIQCKLYVIPYPYLILVNKPSKLRQDKQLRPNKSSNSSHFPYRFLETTSYSSVPLGQFRASGNRSLKPSKRKENVCERYV